MSIAADYRATTAANLLRASAGTIAVGISCSVTPANHTAHDSSAGILTYNILVIQQLNALLSRIQLVGAFLAVPFNFARPTYIRAGQTAAQLQLSLQLVRSLFRALVDELVSQTVKCFLYRSLIEGIDTIGASCHDNLAASVSIVDDGVSCLIDNFLLVVKSTSHSILKFMVIKNLDHARQIVDGQSIFILLVNQASIVNTSTTSQIGNTAAVELLAAPYARQNALLLIDPGCTILQPQVYCTGKELAVTLLRFSFAAFRELVINNTGKLGVLRSQAKINFCFRAAICIVYCAYRSNNIAGNINLVVAGANNFAISILNGIYVNLAVSCINRTVAILLRGIGINDINPAAVHVNGCATLVSKQTITYAGDIYIAVYVNRAANCSAIACMCINACCTVFIKAAAVAINFNLNVAVNRCAACIAVDTHGGVVTLYVNINIAVNS